MGESATDRGIILSQRKSNHTRTLNCRTWIYVLLLITLHTALLMRFSYAIVPNGLILNRIVFSSSIFWEHVCWFRTAYFKERNLPHSFLINCAQFSTDFGLVFTKIPKIYESNTFEILCKPKRLFGTKTTQTLRNRTWEKEWPTYRDVY